MGVEVYIFQLTNGVTNVYGKTKYVSFSSMVSLANNKKKASSTAMSNTVVNYHQAFVNPAVEINLELELIFLFIAVT